MSQNAGRNYFAIVIAEGFDTPALAADGTIDSFARVI